MGYQNIEELKHLPKDEAKHLYQVAYERFTTSETGVFFKYVLLVGLGAGLGAGIGSYFANETHLGVYLAAIGAGVGHYLMTKLIERKMKPYFQEVVDETST